MCISVKLYIIDTKGNQMKLFLIIFDMFYGRVYNKITIYGVNGKDEIDHKWWLSGMHNREASDISSN